MPSTSTAPPPSLPSVSGASTSAVQVTKKKIRKGKEPAKKFAAPVVNPRRGVTPPPVAASTPVADASSVQQKRRKRNRRSRRSRRSDTTAPPSVGSPASMTPPGTPPRPESPPPPVATLSDADSPIRLRQGGRRRVLLAETSSDSDEGRHSSEDDAPRQPKRPRSSRTAEARREKQRQKHPLRPPCHCKTLECHKKINEERRRHIHDMFYQMSEDNGRVWCWRYVFTILHLAYYV